VSQLRSDLWCAAFLRRNNDIGRICVVVRRGDPLAGQIFIEVDHLNGAVSLYAPAPSALAGDTADRVFQRRFDRVEPTTVRDRLEREAEFDPDFWHLSVEMRSGDLGLLVIG
jgi:hypothetical protein